MKYLHYFLLCLPLGLCAQYPTEKVHIQTTKTTYLAGDTLWFSAFLWATNDSVPSKVLYVELLSPSVFLVGERTLKIENEPVLHYFVFDSVATGTYTLRAYTHYLTGFGNDAFFEKQIQVSRDPSQTFDRSVTATTKNIQFAVEGGNLVEGLPSRLFFQTPKPNQSGLLKDDLNATFASFTSDAEGLAIVPIVPAKNRNYRVELIAVFNDVQAFALDKTKPSGATLQLNTIDSLLVIKTYTQQLETDSTTMTFYYENRAIFQETTASRPVQILKLPTKLLPIGLIQCIVTDNKSQILAERLWLNESPKNNLSKMARYNVLDYYLEKPLPDESKNINNLLILNSLKRFKQTSFFTKEQGLLRRAIATDTKNNVLKKTELVAWSPSKGFGIHSVVTDTTGVFEIKNIDNEGLVELKVQTNDDVLVAVRWLPRQIAPANENSTASAIVATTGIDVPLIDGKQLEEVVIKAKQNFDKIKTRMGIRYAFADKTIEGSQLLSITNASSTLRAIQIIYPLINIATGSDGREYPQRHGRPVSVLVDGSFWPELPTVETIARIDITSYLGADGIYIYTRNFINSFNGNKPNKPFEGNAFLKGFDVSAK
jgi:hypothetical protein